MSLSWTVFSFICIGTLVCMAGYFIIGFWYFKGRHDPSYWFPCAAILIGLVLLVCLDNYYWGLTESALVYMCAIPLLVLHVPVIFLINVRNTA